MAHLGPVRVNGMEDELERIQLSLSEERLGDEPSAEACGDSIKISGLNFFTMASKVSGLLLLYTSA